MGICNIAVVDDDDITLDIITNALETHYSATVYAFSHPKVALDYLRKQNADSLQLVISDVMMPGMNGIELMQQTHQAGVRVPFIFITANVTREIVLKAAQAGATDFIAKPVTPATLYAKVDQVLPPRANH